MQPVRPLHTSLPQVVRFIRKRGITPHQAQRQTGLQREDRGQRPGDPSPGRCLDAAPQRLPHGFGPGRLVPERRYIRLGVHDVPPHQQVRRQSPGEYRRQRQSGQRVDGSLQAPGSGHLAPGEREHGARGDERHQDGSPARGHDTSEGSARDRGHGQQERLTAALAGQRAGRVSADEVRAPVGRPAVLGRQPAEAAAMMMRTADIRCEGDPEPGLCHAPEPLVVLVPVGPGDIEWLRIVDIAGEDRVSRDRRIAVPPAEVPDGDRIGTRDARGLGRDNVAIHEPAPEAVADGPHPAGHHPPALREQARNRRGEPARVHHDVRVRQREQLAVRLAQALVALYIRVALARGQLLLQHDQPRVGDASQRAPGGIPGIADQDHLLQVPVVLGEQGLDCRQDRALVASARDDHAHGRAGAREAGHDRRDGHWAVRGTARSDDGRGRPHWHEQAPGVVRHGREGPAIRQHVVQHGEDHRGHHAGDEPARAEMNQNGIQCQARDGQQQLLHAEAPAR